MNFFPHAPFALVSDFISPSKSVNAPIRGSMLKHPLFFSRPEIRAAPGDEVNHESIRSRMQSQSNCRGTRVPLRISYPVPQIRIILSIVQNYSHEDLRVSNEIGQ